MRMREGLTTSWTMIVLKRSTPFEFVKFMARYAIYKRPEGISLTCEAQLVGIR